MPIIDYFGGKKVETDTSTSILETSLKAGIPHTHVCGGNARCSTCRVFVIQGLENCSARNEKEKDLAGQRHFDPHIRLACQTTVSGDVTLRRLVLDEDDVQGILQEVSGGADAHIGEEKRITILFNDMRDFTRFSEGNLPYDMVHFLNRYFHAVNTASRIESANKKAGTQLLVSQEAYEPAKDFVRAGKKLSVPIRGKQGRHRLYEILSLEEPGEAPSRNP